MALKPVPKPRNEIVSRKWNGWSLGQKSNQEERVVAWKFATSLSEIVMTCKESKELQEAMVKLIATRPSGSKALEGPGRRERFNQIFRLLLVGNLTLEEAIQQTKLRLSPESGSPHKGNKSVFTSSWERRLVETVLGRRYCEVVLKYLIDQGQEVCFVPNLAPKDKTCDRCAAFAGKEHPVVPLYEKLVRSEERKQTDAERHKGLVVPMHPYCKHVVSPRFK